MASTDTALADRRLASVRAMTAPTIRVPTAADADVWWALFDDPEVMRFVGAGEVRDRAHYGDLVARQQALAASTGLCLFTVVAQDEVVGFAGFHPWTYPWGPHGALELGWRLGRRFWGRGLATAAARAALHVAQDRSVAELVSMIQDGNEASMAVARKLGMAPTREHRSPEGTLVHEFGLALG